MVETTNAESSPWEVQTNPQDGSAPRRLFSGTEDDARDFIENNFPRLHVEPGVLYGDEGPEPDAVLVAPGTGKNRKREAFDGSEWSEHK